MEKEELGRIRFVQYHNSISEKLLISFKDGIINLFGDYICITCFGILVNPMECKICHAVSCRDCIKENSRSKLFCHCNKIERKNFIPTKIPKLEETQYLIQDTRDLSVPSMHQYNQAIIKFSNASNFLPSTRASFEIYKSSLLINEYFGTERLIEMEDCYFHILKEINLRYFNLKLSLMKNVLKIAKLINLNCSKGYAIDLENLRKSFCAKDSLLLKLIHVKSLKIGDTLNDLSFVINLSRTIKENRKYLKSLHLINYKDLMDERKKYIILYKAISICSLLKTLKIRNNFFDKLLFMQKCTTLLDNNEYKFISQKKYFLLKKLTINNDIFLRNQDFHYFEALLCLENFQLKDCYFQGIAFISLMQSILKRKDKHLRQLRLANLEIYEMWANDENNIEKLQNFKQLLFEQSKLEILQITNEFNETAFSNFWDIPNTLLILPSQAQKILEIDIGFPSAGIRLNEINGFAVFIKKTKILKKLTLELNDLQYNYWHLILQALSLNNSLDQLNLSSNDLSKSDYDVKNLIENNTSISKLYLASCKLSIDSNFSDAILKSKSLIEINLAINTFEDKELVFPLLIQSKLKKIYLHNIIFLPDNIKKLIKEDPFHRFEEY